MDKISQDLNEKIDSKFEPGNIVTLENIYVSLMESGYEVRITNPVTIHGKILTSTPDNMVIWDLDRQISCHIRVKHMCLPHEQRPEDTTRYTNSDLTEISEETRLWLIENSPEVAKSKKDWVTTPRPTFHRVFTSRPDIEHIYEGEELVKNDNHKKGTEKKPVNIISNGSTPSVNGKHNDQIDQEKFELGNLLNKKITVNVSKNVKVVIFELFGNLNEAQLSNIPDGVITEIRKLHGKDMVVIQRKISDNETLEYGVPINEFKFALQSGFIKVDKTEAEATLTKLMQEGLYVEITNVQADVAYGNEKALPRKVDVVTGKINYLFPEIICVEDEHEIKYFIAKNSLNDSNYNIVPSKKDVRSESSVSAPVIPQGIASIQAGTKIEPKKTEVKPDIPQRQFLAPSSLSNTTFADEQVKLALSNTRRDSYKLRKFTPDFKQLSNKESNLVKYFREFGINITIELGKKNLLIEKDRAILVTYMEKLFFNCDVNGKEFNEEAIRELCNRIVEAKQYKEKYTNELAQNQDVSTSLNRVESELGSLTRVHSVLMHLITGNPVEL